MTEEEIMSLDKMQIRGAETIEDILKQAKSEVISLDRIYIENIL